MSRVIGIVSAKGGVGKTTTAVNLAAALATYDINNSGRNVLVMDGNLTAPHVCLHLGMFGFDASLNDLMKGKGEVEKAIYTHPCGMKVVPAALPLEEIIGIKPSRLKDVVNEVSGHTDILIVDTAPGLGNESVSALKSCDEIIIVTNPSIPSITDALKTIKVAKKLKIKLLGIVMNRVKNKRYELKVNDVENLTELPVLGVIPEDEEVLKSVAEKTPVVLYDSYSPASIGFLKLAGSIIGKEYKPPELSVFDKTKLRLRTFYGNVSTRIREFF